MLNWLGMTFSENVIPCQLSRLSQIWLNTVMTRLFWWLCHSVWLSQNKSYRVLCSDILWHDIESHTVCMLHGFVWYDFIMSYRVCVLGILCCVYDLHLNDLKKSYKTHQNDFIWLSHAKWTLEAKQKCHTAPGSMTLLIYVIPFLF